MENKRKTQTGSVISHKMDKTAVVAVGKSKRHPLYNKAVKRTVKYKAHDEKNESRVGDKVIIEETRPLSREKRWRIAQIVTRREAIEVKPEEIGTLEVQPS